MKRQTAHKKVAEDVILALGGINKTAVILDVKPPTVRLWLRRGMPAMKLAAAHALLRARAHSKKRQAPKPPALAAMNMRADMPRHS